MTTTKQARMGVDIGRVIINGSTRGDTSFFGRDLDSAMLTPAVPGAVAAVAALVTMFEGRVHLVSKCGPRIQARSLAWLDHHDFWATTGLARDQVRFCRERRDKAIHARELGLTHFVDDRFDVLRHLVGLVDHLYLFGPQTKRRPGSATRGMLATATWPAVLAAVGQTGVSSTDGDPSVDDQSCPDRDDRREPRRARERDRERGRL